MTRPSPTPHDQADGLAGPGSAEDLEALLMYLKQSRGFDFAAYKRSGLMRRIRVRMQTIGIVTFDDYQDYLEVDPDEFTRLFNTILINVTTFFRDGSTWEYLAEQVLPMLGGDREGAQPIRIWSAGCASGEEPYTIAMLMAERLGAEQFRERVKIYATDADEDALSQARLAGYTEGNVRDVPPHLLEKYFDRVDDRFIFNKELRRSVIFGRHDLIQDPPISRVHLLICRNCLMYFNAEVQSRILARFHFALAGGGVLFLGKAETLLTNATTFRALDVKRRLFTKAELHPADRPALLDSERVAAFDGSDQMRIRNSAADVSPVAQLLVDSNGIVVQMNHQLRNLFGLSPRDLGRRLQDLELSYRPFELRSCIQQAYADGRTMTRGEGVWTTPTGDSVTLDLKVIPVPDGNAGFLGAGVYYEDVTRQRRLEDEVRRTSQELEAALEEDMRHESGHYYWDILIGGTPEVDEFRSLFGDERVDYDVSLTTYYQTGACADWQERFVSAYATSHPWEDWAETWAQYLHMVDTLETAAACGLSLTPRRRDEPTAPTMPQPVSPQPAAFPDLIDSWFPLTYVLNNLNRGLGHADAYPFVLSPPAVAKLKFVDDVVGRAKVGGTGNVGDPQKDGVTEQPSDELCFPRGKRLLVATGHRP